LIGSSVQIYITNEGGGLYAVQFTRWKGAHVTAAASAANIDFVRLLGAERVIDYHATQFEDVVKDVDAVIDTVGGDLLKRSMRLIRPGEVYATTAGRVVPEQARFAAPEPKRILRRRLPNCSRSSHYDNANRSLPWWGKCFH
jgi:NADPH:quinone reductase-like Zn-dependent oxidoreductase